MYFIKGLKRFGLFLCFCRSIGDGKGRFDLWSNHFGPFCPFAHLSPISKPAVTHMGPFGINPQSINQRYTNLFRCFQNIIYTQGVDFCPWGSHMNDFHSFAKSKEKWKIKPCQISWGHRKGDKGSNPNSGPPL